MAGQEHTAPIRRDLGDLCAGLPLHQGVQPSGRLVEDEQFRVVHERLHEPDLSVCCLRQCPDRSCQVQAEALGQGVDAGAGHAAAQFAEEGEHLADGQAGLQPRSPGR